MIELKANETVYQVPTSWHDLTFKQWIDLQDKKLNAEIITVLTGIPQSVLDCIQQHDFEKLASLVSFLDQPIEFDRYRPPATIAINGVEVPLVDIKEKTFGQKIVLHELLREKQEVNMDMMPMILMIYAQPYIDDSDFDHVRVEELLEAVNDLSLVDVYATGMHYIEQITALIELENEELSTTPTTEQRQAGIDNFSEFGVMNTIKALAMGDILKYNEVLKIEYNMVFLHMKMNKVDGIFKDNYAKVLRKKAK